MSPQRHNAIKNAVETDWNHREGKKPSLAVVSGRWVAIMQQILKMPVSKWDCPATASGEISAAR